MVAGRIKQISDAPTPYHTPDLYTPHAEQYKLPPAFAAVLVPRDYAHRFR